MEEPEWEYPLAGTPEFLEREKAKREAKRLTDERGVVSRQAGNLATSNDADTADSQTDNQVNNIFNRVNSLLENVKTCFKDNWWDSVNCINNDKYFRPAADTIASYASNLLQGILEGFGESFNWFTVVTGLVGSFITSMLSGGSSLVLGFVSSLINIITKVSVVYQAIKGSINFIYASMEERIKSIGKAVGNLVGDSLVDMISGLAGNLFDGIKGLVTKVNKLPNTKPTPKKTTNPDNCLTSTSILDRLMWRVQARACKKPRNSKFSGQTLTKDTPGLSQNQINALKNHNKPLYWKEAGYPDFSPFAKYEVDIKKLNSSRNKDFSAADRIVGITTKDRAGYTWHHVENTTKMQLVPSDLHSAFGHTGGVATNKN